MKLQPEIILKVLTERESLVIPDWCFMPYDPEYSINQWLPHSTTSAISWEYPADEECGQMLKVVALPPIGDPEYKYEEQGGEDKRRFFLLGDDGPVEIKREKLLCHSVNFIELAKAVARACGIDGRSSRQQPLIPDKLQKIADGPVSAYFTFSFTTSDIELCMQTIRREQPSGRVVILVLGSRWHTTAIQQVKTNYNCIIYSINELMDSTTDGLRWRSRLTWEALCANQRQTHERLVPDGAQWEDLLISVEDGDEGYIVRYFFMNSESEEEYYSENMRDVPIFFSKKRAAHDKDDMKPAFKYLITMAAQPDAPCVTDILFRSISKPEDARKALIGHLAELFPELRAKSSPFVTSRKGKTKVSRLFRVKLADGISRAIPGFIEKRQRAKKSL